MCSFTNLSATIAFVGEQCANHWQSRYGKEIPSPNAQLQQFSSGLRCKDSTHFCHANLMWTLRWHFFIGLSHKSCALFGGTMLRNYPCLLSYRRSTYAPSQQHVPCLHSSRQITLLSTCSLFERPLIRNVLLFLELTKRPSNLTQNQWCIGNFYCIFSKKTSSPRGKIV